MKPLPFQVPGVISANDIDVIFSNIPEDYCDSFEEMIEYCARTLLPQQLLVMADCGMTVRAQRALLLACSRHNSRAFISCLAVDSDGNTFDGWESAAALVMLQNMGAVAVLLVAQNEETVQEMPTIIANLRQDAKIPIGVISNENKWEIASNMPITERAEFVAVSNGCTHLLDATFDVDAEICDFADFPEQILELENQGCTALRVDIGDEDELDIFAKEEYMIKTALCISAPNEQLFASAVRAFCGRAMYDGTAQMEPEFLADMTKKYGLIIL